MSASSARARATPASPVLIAIAAAPFNDFARPRVSASSSASAVLEPAPTLAQVPAQVPESPDRADETQDSLVLARRREEGDRRADVVVVELESIEQLAAARRELGFGALGDLEKETGVALAHLFGLTRNAQLLCGVLADRFEHRQSRFRSTLTRAGRGSSPRAARGS